MPLRSRTPSPEALARVLAVLDAPPRTSGAGWVPTAVSVPAAPVPAAVADRYAPAPAQRMAPVVLAQTEQPPSEPAPFVPPRAPFLPAPAPLVQPVPGGVGVGSVLERLRAGRWTRGVVARSRWWASRCSPPGWPGWFC